MPPETTERGLNQVMVEIPTTGHPDDRDALIELQHRRITEQDAEIERLRTALAGVCVQNNVRIIWKIAQEALNRV